MAAVTQLHNIILPTEKNTSLEGILKGKILLFEQNYIIKGVLKAMKVDPNYTPI